MIACNIIDIKQFMNLILVKEAFDTFLLFEAQVKGAVTYVIDGGLNNDFFDDEEKEKMKDDYVSWKDQKDIIYNIIKGKKLPLSFKFILMLNNQNKIKIIEQNNVTLDQGDIWGLYANIYYDKGNLRVTTGVSLKNFTLDKTLDNLWDENIKSFLKSLEIAYEII